MGILDDNRIRNAILNQAIKRREVIYGAQSVNIQLPEHLRKKTKDYDVLDSNSKEAADELAASLKLVKHYIKEHSRLKILKEIVLQIILKLQRNRIVLITLV